MRACVVPALALLNVPVPLYRAARPATAQRAPLKPPPQRAVAGEEGRAGATKRVVYEGGGA